ncbi:MAG: DUF2878 domain-containing protein [Rudaea sp.]
MSARTAIWTNAILFQFAWMVTVAGAARGAWWAGPIAVGVFATYQLVRGGHARADALLILLAVALGFGADSLLVQCHFASYAAAVPSDRYAPIWILALWANFALTLNHSLAWLQSRPLLAAVLGTVGAPLSYFFAARSWHALTLADPLATTLALLAAIWAVVTPLLCEAALRLNRSHAASAVKPAAGLY